ncbi:MAG: CehA/McbA family metallohydrolase [Polyangiales bacterium]
MALIAHARERYLRIPRLEARARGGARLHVIAWEPEGERPLTYELDGEGEVVGEPEAGERRAAIATLEPGLPLRPTDDVEAERCAVDGAWRATVTYEQGGAEIAVTGPDGGRTVVWSSRCGTAAAPAIAVADGGAWVAFHHDVREDTDERDVAKWIALRFVDDDGRVHEPAEEMTDRDRDLEGVEQSFEFPAIALGDDGAVALFGRGSHNFWRQDVSFEGFSERTAMSDGEWGCRGRRISAVRLSDGALLVARRERQGVAVERQEPPRGGPPTLRVAQVEVGAERVEPARAQASDPAASDRRRTLFGDIHQHSAHSDAIGTADECYLRARWVYGDDFAALTDHESFLGKRIGPGEWRYLERVAEAHHEAGRFATILAYEWTGKRYPGPGHKVVYWPEPGRPVISRDDVPEGRDLVEAVKARGGFAVPHHVGWTGADEPGHDPQGQPVWEICSCHGCYEYADHPLGQRGEHRDQLVQQMLRKGHRFGFIACSDSHGLVRHHGIARKRDPFRTGLTAVQATDVTRDAILSAIRDRRCYATSGAKILLGLRAGEVPMGGVVRSAGPVSVEATAGGEGIIDRLELVGPDAVLAEARGDGTESTVAVGAEVRAPWVYARCTRRDGEMAWSSPIFVEPA